LFSLFYFLVFHGNIEKIFFAELPRYKGPPPPPNRFCIAPGYRWDGVDRSNGFERSIYAKLSDKKAVADMAYKWSVEDM
jgi:pre-mRNA-splicing factor CWC26